MNIERMTGKKLLPYVDTKSVWGALKESAWWYNRKKTLIAPGRIVVIFQLFIGPGKSIVLDAEGNKYDESWEAATALGLPLHDRVIAFTPHNIPLGEKATLKEAGVDKPLRGIGSELADKIESSFEEVLPQNSKSLGSPCFPLHGP